MELGVNSNVIQHFIEQARAYHAHENVLFDDFSNSVVSDNNLPLTNQFGEIIYRDAVETVNTLDPEQQATFVALMYIGRGDFDSSEWEEALRLARNYWTTHTGEYLLSRPLVANHLEEALEQLHDTNRD